MISINRHCFISFQIKQNDIHSETKPNHYSLLKIWNLKLEISSKIMLLRKHQKCPKLKGPNSRWFQSKIQDWVHLCLWKSPSRPFWVWSCSPWSGWPLQRTWRHTGTRCPSGISCQTTYLEDSSMAPGSQVKQNQFQKTYFMVQ